MTDLEKLIERALELDERLRSDDNYPRLVDQSTLDTMCEIVDVSPKLLSVCNVMMDALSKVHCISEEADIENSAFETLREVQKILEGK